MKKIIFGTDWWTDCDDAVALRLITRAVKRGEAELLGICINAVMEYSAASLRGFLDAEKITDVPLGIDLAATDFGGRPPYQKRLAEMYCPAGRNEDAMDGVRLYRKLLAEADGPLEMIEVGFLQVVAALLKSGADDISPKSGCELVREKVRRIWVMAGKWDGDGERENNFCRNPRSRRAGMEVCSLCPVPITFLGWEIGYGVLTGGGLPHDDPLYRILEDHGSANGRHSWDPMLTLMALIGDEEAAGYRTVTGTAAVDEADGANHFTEHPHGLHRYVVKKFADAYYRDEINRRL